MARDGWNVNALGRAVSRDWGPCPPSRFPHLPRDRPGQAGRAVMWQMVPTVTLLPADFHSARLFGAWPCTATRGIPGVGHLLLLSSMSCDWFGALRLRERSGKQGPLRPCAPKWPGGSASVRPGGATALGMAVGAMLPFRVFEAGPLEVRRTPAGTTLYRASFRFVPGNPRVELDPGVDAEKPAFSGCNWRSVVRGGPSGRCL